MEYYRTNATRTSIAGAAKSELGATKDIGLELPGVCAALLDEEFEAAVVESGAALAVLEDVADLRREQ